MFKLLHNPWSEETEVVSRELETHLQNGLSDEAVKERLKSVGENIFESAKEKSASTIFARQFTSPLIIILCIAAIITASLAEWLDTAIIAFAVIVNAILGFIQEYKAEKAI